MRIIPDEVTVTIPVEPLVAKRRTIQIKPRGVPSESSLLTFPAAIELSYLLPMSLYSTDNYNPVAIVNYSEINPDSKTVPVKILNVPDYYRSVVTTPSEVEYVIDRKHSGHEEE